MSCTIFYAIKSRQVAAGLRRRDDIVGTQSVRRCFERNWDDGSAPFLALFDDVLEGIQNTVIKFSRKILLR